MICSGATPRRPGICPLGPGSSSGGGVRLAPQLGDRGRVVRRAEREVLVKGTVAYLEGVWPWLLALVGLQFWRWRAGERVPGSQSQPATADPPRLREDKGTDDDAPPDAPEER